MLVHTSTQYEPTHVIWVYTCVYVHTPISNTRVYTHVHVNALKHIHVLGLASQFQTMSLSRLWVWETKYLPMAVLPKGLVHI